MADFNINLTGAQIQDALNIVNDGGTNIRYFGPVNVENSMRARHDNVTGYLHFERLESGTWTEKFSITESIAVDVVHLTESAGAPAVPSGDVCVYNLRIRDDQGAQILRPIFTDGTNSFIPLGSAADGSVRVIQNLTDVLANPDTTNSEYKFLATTTDLENKQDDLGTPASDDQLIVFDQDGSTRFEDMPAGPLTTKEVEDIVGTMFTGNTETGITSSYDDTTGKITLTVSSGPAPTQEFKVFSQATNVVTESVINAVTDEGTSLPYRYFLPTPINTYMVVAWHASTSVQDIHVNVLDADATTDDIETSPLGNRFVQSQVQTAGVFSYMVLDISGDTGLLTAGQKLGIYVG